MYDLQANLYLWNSKLYQTQQGCCQPFPFPPHSTTVQWNTIHDIIISSIAFCQIVKYYTEQYIKYLKKHIHYYIMQKLSRNREMIYIYICVCLWYILYIRYVFLSYQSYLYKSISAFHKPGRAINCKTSLPSHQQQPSTVANYFLDFPKMVALSVRHHGSIHVAFCHDMVQ